MFDPYIVTETGSSEEYDDDEEEEIDDSDDGRTIYSNYYLDHHYYEPEGTPEPRAVIQDTVFETCSCFPNRDNKLRGSMLYDKITCKHNGLTGRQRVDPEGRQRVWIPLENNKNIGFPSNTGPDPMKNHIASKPALNLMLGHNRPTKETFK